MTILQKNWLRLDKVCQHPLFLTRWPCRHQLLVSMNGPSFWCTVPTTSRYIHLVNVTRALSFHSPPCHMTWRCNFVCLNVNLLTIWNVVTPTSNKIKLNQFNRINYSSYRVNTSKNIFFKYLECKLILWMFFQIGQGKILIKVWVRLQSNYIARKWQNDQGNSS